MSLAHVFFWPARRAGGGWLVFPYWVGADALSCFQTGLSTFFGSLIVGDVAGSLEPWSSFGIV